MNIELMTALTELNSSKATLQVAYDKVVSIVPERKDVVSALTLLGFESKDIAIVTKPITRQRSGDFRKDYYSFLTNEGIKSDDEAKKFVESYPDVTANTLKSLKLFIRDAQLQRDIRVDERARVMSEIEAAKVKPSKK